MRLLLAEDEKELSNAVAAILKHNNYSVDVVCNGNDALDYAMSGNYDALLLDIMMPGLSGLEVLRAVRDKGIKTPAIMLTAKSEIEDRIAGLDAGADDYLPKPFAMGELLARIRAVTRRSNDYQPNILSCGKITLNRDNYELSGPKLTIRLAGKEYQMLEMLMSSYGRLISLESFMERIWGFDSETDSSVVWVYVSNLRKKLVAIGSDIQIKAIRNGGYILTEKEEK